MNCDLHLHTSASDGLFSPEEIVKMAKEKGLDCISVTDHDTVAGVKAAQKAAKQLGITVVVGIEISTVSKEAEVHMLGYNLDIDHKNFSADIKKIVQMRELRNVALVEKLCQNGFHVSLEEITKKAEDSTIGRPDIAKEMVSKGYCKDVSEAFDKYIGKGRPFYVQTQRLSPKEAIEFVHKYKGVAVLAHPRNLHMGYIEFEQFVKTLVSFGLDGIEAEYFTHTKSERKFYNKIARKYGLIITGGSDFHDFSHGADMGKRHFSPSSLTKSKLGIE